MKDLTNLPLMPEYGDCDYCGQYGCYPYRHNGLENEAQAIRLARITAKDHTASPRARDLAEFFLASLKVKS